jgi:peptide/nickel transport system substrate-binding protein
VFDPFYASDGETFRITRQIFQGLLGIKPGTADPARAGRELGAVRRRSDLEFKLRRG